jgi:hypothetical protein
LASEDGEETKDDTHMQEATNVKEGEELEEEEMFPLEDIDEA